MSNTLAVATVTAALKDLLQTAINHEANVNQADLSGAHATAVRPDNLPNGTSSAAVKTGINIYLYQVTPNPALRNADLPMHSSDRRIMQRPQAALDLHYLLSFFGDDSDLQPQRLLGIAVRALQSQPVLSRQSLYNVTTGSSYPYLAASDLAAAVEMVKFTPTNLSLEELSKLWSVFFQTHYTLSVAYQATVVLIESEDAPQQSLPVRDRMIDTVPFRQPVVDTVVPETGAGAPTVASTMLLIRGHGLRGDITQVQLRGIDVTIALTEVSDTQLRLSLPALLSAGLLRAGVQGLQVVQPIPIGVPPAPHPGVQFESNVAALVVRPTIASVSSTTTPASPSQNTPSVAHVTVTVDLPIGPQQRVVLLLNEMAGADAAAYSFTARAVPPRASDVLSITIDEPNVKPGTYLVRLQVDGAESPLDVDTNQSSPTYNHYVGTPQVVIS